MTMFVGETGGVIVILSCHFLVTHTVIISLNGVGRLFYLVKSCSVYRAFILEQHYTPRTRLSNSESTRPLFRIYQQGPECPSISRHAAIVYRVHIGKTSGCEDCAAY